MVLLLDNYDSFTYNLYDYLLQTGVECEVVRNDAIQSVDFEALDFDAVVLSPGPKRPVDAGCMMDFIQYFYLSKPMLGVCLGHQALGEFFGARLVHAPEPVHGKTSLIRHNGQHDLFKDIPTELSVMRYHSLSLTDLKSTPFECTAQTKEGDIMAMAHRELPLWGVQYHPESILTEYGLQMIRNWVEFCFAKVNLDQH